MLYTILPSVLWPYLESIGSKDRMNSLISTPDLWLADSLVKYYVRISYHAAYKSNRAQRLTSFNMRFILWKLQSLQIYDKIFFDHCYGQPVDQTSKECACTPQTSLELCDLPHPEFDISLCSNHHQPDNNIAGEDEGGRDTSNSPIAENNWLDQQV